jgi:hypothetical protein
MLAMWEVYRRTGDCGALDKLQATLQVRTCVGSLGAAASVVRAVGLFRVSRGGSSVGLRGGGLRGRGRALLWGSRLPFASRPPACRETTNRRPALPQDMT